MTEHSKGDGDRLRKTFKWVFGCHRILWGKNCPNWTSKQYKYCHQCELDLIEELENWPDT